MQMFKAKVNRKDILKELQVVSLITEKNNKFTAQKGVVLEAKEEKLILKNSTSDIQIKIEIETLGYCHGEIAVDPNILIDFLKNLSGEYICLKKKNNVLEIEGLKVQLYDILEQEKIINKQLGTEYEFNVKKLQNFLENVKIAASKEIANEAINAVKFVIEENKLKLAATDTFRLAYLEEVLDNNQRNKESMEFSLPLKTVEILIKAFKKVKDGVVKFGYVGDRLSIEFNGIEIISKLIEFPFPDYKSIMKYCERDIKILLNTKTFLGVLNRISVIAKKNLSSKNGAVFKIKKDKLEIVGFNQNEKVIEEIDIFNENGKELTISLNVKFLIDYLKRISDKLVEMKLADRQSVILNGETNNKFIYLTMPLSLREE